MAYVLPTFNTTCSIWTNGTGPPALPRVATICQLRWGPSLTGQNYVNLLLPAGTDIRGQYHSTGKDLVEVPTGSGRLYECVWMDDTAFAFPNQHRQAVLVWKIPFLTPTP